MLPRVPLAFNGARKLDVGSHQRAWCSTEQTDRRIRSDATGTRSAMTAPTAHTDHERLVLGRLRRQLVAGHGRGRGEAYKAWLRVRRRSSSRVSHPILSHLPLAMRSYHLLSKEEENASLVLSWLGAKEIREGLPAWPIDHPHPAIGWDASSEKSLGWVPGLLDIAKSAGIYHGDIAGTRIPYIATIDIVAILPPMPSNRLLFIGCKPTKFLLEDERAIERLELERRYARSCGGRHRIVHEATFDAQLVENLRCYAPRYDTLTRVESMPQFLEFCAEFVRISADRPVVVARDQCARLFGVLEDAELMLRAGIWLREIDADLSKPIVRASPLVCDHGRVARSLVSSLMGDEDE